MDIINRFDRLVTMLRFVFLYYVVVKGVPFNNNTRNRYTNIDHTYSCEYMQRTCEHGK